MLAVVNEIRLHYVVHGRVDGLPLLFIHGYPFSGELWWPLVELLKDQCRLIIPDLRGFGQSELAPHVKPGETVPLSMSLFADDLRLLLEEIGEDRPLVVIGLSMGGYVAFEFYRRFTSNVMALVLADTRAQADTREQKHERQQTAQRVLTDGSRVVADAMVEKLFAPSTPRELREHWRHNMSLVRPETIASTLLAMASRPDSTPTLSSILCPTLVIVGEHDAITPLADARRIYESLLAAKLEVIVGAGHMTPVEKPHKFAEALRRFVAEHAPRIQETSGEPVAALRATGSPGRRPIRI